MHALDVIQSQVLQAEGIGQLGRHGICISSHNLVLLFHMGRVQLTTMINIPQLQGWGWTRTDGRTCEVFLKVNFLQNVVAIRGTSLW